MISKEDRFIGVGLVYAALATIMVSLFVAMDGYNVSPLFGISIGLGATGLWVLRSVSAAGFIYALSLGAIVFFADILGSLLGVSGNAVRLLAIIGLSVKTSMDKQNRNRRR